MKKEHTLVNWMATNQTLTEGHRTGLLIVVHIESWE